jgi:AraC-like DNA-binding protein
LPSDDKDLSLRDMDVPIRASILRGLPTLVSELGGSGEEFLAAYGVDAESTAHGDGFISLRLVERILDDAAQQLGTFDFGLRMAGQQDLQILGPLAIAMENSRTVGDALECASRFLFVLSPAFSHAVVPDPLGNPGVVGLRFASSTAKEFPQGVDYGVGVVHRTVSLLHGGGPYGLRSVQLPHPALAPEPVYREHFGAEVAFDCPEAVLRVPRHILETPISGGNVLLHDIAIDFLESHFSHRSVPVSALVSAILDGQLGPDRPDLAKVARLLGLHERSLQRVLAGEGVRFKDLVDAVRREQTLDLLSSTDLSFSQIAVRVGLHEQSSLTRAAKRWFGMSPSEVRRTREARQRSSSTHDAGDPGPPTAAEPT